MSSSLTVAVTDLALSSDLPEPLAQLAQQQLPPARVLIVNDGDSPPLPAETWSAQFPNLTLQLVQLKQKRTAAQHNELLGHANTHYFAFVAPGMRIDPTFYSVSIGHLNDHPEVPFVSSWWREEWFDSITTHKFNASLETLIGNSSAIHSGAVFRKEAWQEAGCFDEQLTHHVLYDFWLRITKQLGSGLMVEQELVRQLHHLAPLGQRRWERETYLPEMMTLFDKHRSTFEEMSSEALVGRETRLRHLWSTLDHREQRHRKTEQEIKVLREEIDRARKRLAQAGQNVVDWGDLRQTLPLSTNWGYDRGRPVDRHYIELFLSQHKHDICGAVLEIQESDYTIKYGEDRVVVSDILDLNPANPRATIVADLRKLDRIQDASYDCIILTQTLHVIDQMDAAVASCYRILKPGGVILATLPCLSRVCLEYGEQGDFWRVTKAGAEALFRSCFPDEAVQATAYGNVLVSAAFLYGVALEELTDAEFAAADPYNPMLVSVRAQKPADVSRKSSAQQTDESDSRAAILLYHRVADRTPDRQELCVSPKQFRAQMKQLKDRFEVISLSDLTAHLEARQCPKRTIVLSFDDGYADMLDTVAPVLTELKLPAIFFAVANTVEHNKAYWWDLLDAVLLGKDKLPTHLSLSVSGDLFEWATKTRKQRKTAYGEIYQHIIRAPAVVQRHVIDQIESWANAENILSPADRPMTTEEWQQIENEPLFDIGGHGLFHLALSHQSDETVRQEIMDGKRSLQDHLGTKIEHFAYPHGDYDQRARSLAAAAGYRSAVTCEARCLRIQENLFALPRIEVKDNCADIESLLKQHVGAKKSVTL